MENKRDWYVAGEYITKTPRQQVGEIMQERAATELGSIVDQIRADIEKHPENYVFPNGEQMTVPQAIGYTLLLRSKSTNRPAPVDR